MFKAYFDDSSSDEGSQTLLLAGCVQKYSVWADFSIAWEAALVEEPSIKYFHMREARKLVGQFARWKAAARNAKIKRLATLVARYEPWTITAWVSRKEHDAILRPITPFLLQQPYFSVFYAVIIKLAHWHYDLGVTLPVDYIFDDQGAVGAEAVLWYEQIRQWQKPEFAALMGSVPKFEDDEAVLPLQAADILAWHIRRHKDNPGEDDSKWPTAPLNGLLRAEVEITKDMLVHMAEQMKQVPGIETVQQRPKKYKKSEMYKTLQALLQK